MKKKTILLATLLFSFFNMHLLNAQNIKTEIISENEYRKVLNFSENMTKNITYNYNLYLSIIFILFLITSLWYVIESKKRLRKTAITISVFFISFVVFNFSTYFYIQNNVKNTSEEIIKNLESKKPEYINDTLKFNMNNDYGYKILSLRINSHVLQNNKKYIMTYYTKQNSLLGLFNIWDYQYVKTEFTFKTRNPIKISDSGKTITASIKNNSSNEYCVKENDLQDKKGKVYTGSIVNGNYQIYPLKYNEIYSINENTYCSYIKENKNVKLIDWDGSTIIQSEVK